jgi:hypothetical protein
MRDVSGSATKQRQSIWQIDFIKPLISLAAAAQALNSAMSQINSGVQYDGSTSGISPTVGTPASPGPTADTVPSAGTQYGTGVATPYLDNTNQALTFNQGNNTTTNQSGFFTGGAGGFAQ